MGNIVGIVKLKEWREDEKFYEYRITNLAGET
jgi:hypothetical protein